VPTIFDANKLLLVIVVILPWVIFAVPNVVTPVTPKVPPTVALAVTANPVPLPLVALI